MAKCPICSSRKGKRKCLVEDAFICSLCCGQSRNPENCAGCSWYKDPSQNRNYKKVPYYSLKQMQDSRTLEDISNVIESTLCRLSVENEETFTDKTAAGIIESYVDKYHFKDSELQFSDPAVETGFNVLSEVINKELSTTPEEQIIKVLATIYRSIQRRTNRGWEYLEFIKKFVGMKAGPGVRVFSRDDFLEPS